MTNSKPFILFIETGNKFNISNLYKDKCELISRNFSGQVITYGDHGEYKFGDVAVKVFPILMPPKFMARIFRPILKIIMTLRTLLCSIYFAFARKRNKKRLDLIVTYDPLTTGVLGVVVSKLTGVPLIVEVNGDYTNWTNYSHINNKFLRKFKRALATRTQKFVFKHCSGIKLLYKSQIDWAEKYTRDKIIRVYPNFLNIKNFTHISDNKTVSIIGFPFDVKGIDIAIAAFKKISDQHQDWRLEILGYYPEHEKQMIEQHINGHEKIERLTPIDRKLMEEYIGKTGIVLCASRTEGFPRVIKEAMKARKACVVSDVGGLGEVFGDSKNGLMFESENVDQLAEKLSQMIGDEALRKQVGQNAEVFATSAYSNSSFNDNVTEFYSCVVNNQQSKHA